MAELPRSVNVVLFIFVHILLGIVCPASLVLLLRKILFPDWD